MASVIGGIPVRSAQLGNRRYLPRPSPEPPGAGAVPDTVDLVVGLREVVGPRGCDDGDGVGVPRCREPAGDGIRCLPFEVERWASRCKLGSGMVVGFIMGAMAAVRNFHHATRG